MGALKPPSQGVFGAVSHLRMLTGRQSLGHSRQADARQTPNDQRRERPCCFPACFNVKCQGTAFL